MNEYGLRLRVEFPRAHVQSVKSPNSLVDWRRKERVDGVDNNDFSRNNDNGFSLNNNNDFSRNNDNNYFYLSNDNGFYLNNNNDFSLNNNNDFSLNNNNDFSLNNNNDFSLNNNNDFYLNNDNDFSLNNNVDFNQLTFFHPGDYDDIKTGPEPPGTDGKTHFTGLEPPGTDGKTHFTGLEPPGTDGKTHFTGLEPPGRDGKTHFTGLEPPGTDGKTHFKPETSGYFSASSLQEFSDLFIKPPLQTTTALQDPFPAPTTHAHLAVNATGGHELAFNLTQPANSSKSGIEWSGEEIGAVLVISLMVPFIICSNLFVIASVVRFRRLHTPTNYFITSLAVVDVVVALATPLAIAVQLFQYGGGDEAHDTVLCLLPNRILMMACGVSLLTLATIAYDRHAALINPLEYVNIMTSKKVGIMLTLSWLYSAAIVWFPITVGWYDVMIPTSSCSSDHLHPTVHILFFLAVFVPSCTVIMICYTRIFLVARHHAQAIAAVEFAVHRRLQARFMQKDTKYAKTLALVIGAFLLLWLPHLIYTFIKAFNKITINIWLETYLILLAVFNSGLNPWIYAFKNNEFRAAFKRMFKDYCGYKFCSTWERRKSLMSGSSVTPRLSRTDSRIVSTILDPATCLQGLEKIGQGLDFMDDYDIEADLDKCTMDDSDENEDELVTPGLDLVPPEENSKPELEGHINWAHDGDDSVVSTADVTDTKYLRTNVGGPISRNQSFTLGLHHVCLGREFQKFVYERPCQCKQSKPSFSHKLTRSTSSVSPSSMTQFSLSPGFGVLKPAPAGKSVSSGLVVSPSYLPTGPGTAKPAFPPSIIISPASPPVADRHQHSHENSAHLTRPRSNHGFLTRLKENANCACVKSKKNAFLHDSFDSRMDSKLFPSPQDSQAEDTCSDIES